MGKYRILIFALLLILPLAVVAGCSEYGKVDQGRVVKYDKEKGVVTLIRDVKNDSQNPEYTLLPPMVYTMPEDAHEIGAEPKAGGRMKIDTKNNQVIIFDPATQSFKTIKYTLIEQKEGVEKNDPLVFDKAENKPKKLPAVDKAKKTITIYSSRQKILTTFSPPDEYFSLPENVWDSGDEVRIYYKETGKARRFMNVSKTDIFKR